MDFENALLTPDEGIVQWPPAKVVTEEAVFFSVTRKTYDEILLHCSLPLRILSQKNIDCLSVELITLMISMINPIDLFLMSSHHSNKLSGP